MYIIQDVGVCCAVQWRTAGVRSLLRDAMKNNGTHTLYAYNVTQK